ncbi:Secreted effector protein PipB2 [Pandoraea iniqua]|uniref:Secreted effector protein PipB2 n=1 Tax=Pandoraea iniqua TaxID=2508288 RepID=A0A5E4YEG8_9BURK|nr:DUF2169 domain-containing protein [Pandoraea iniqua]VVE46725.1 Secreted effector protein PipB2 [Pandoraea iniqua]
MRYDKPPHVMLTLRTDAHGDTTFLTVSLGYLVSGQGALIDEAAAWRFLNGQFGAKPFDMGWKKARGSVAVAGDAIAHTGEPVVALNVSMRLGAIGKRINVLGDRVWQRGLLGWVPTAPRPFTRLPLDLCRAFGGAGHAENRVGVGYYPSGVAPAGKALANLELPESPCTSPERVIEVASLMPLSCEAPLRTRWLGKFDERWQRHGAPCLPIDTDPRFFDAVSDDQCLPAGYFVGNERFEIVGMHEQLETVRGRLPGLRPRLLWQQRASQGESALAQETVHEATLELDTVWLFPNTEHVLLFYRAAWPVEDIDAQDVTGMHVVTERLEDALSATHTLAQRWREDRVHRSRKRAPEPVEAVASANNEGDTRTATEAMHTVLQGTLGRLQTAVGERMSPARAATWWSPSRNTGVEPATVSTPSAPHTSELAYASTSGPPDWLARMRAALAAAGGDAVLREAFFTHKTSPSGAPDHAGVDALGTLEQAVREVRLPGGAEGTLNASLAELRAGLQATRESVMSTSSERVSVHHTLLPRHGKLCIGRETFLSRSAAGESLSRIVLENADLSGVDLSGADCRESEFVSCDFSGANVTRANVADATFSKCNLSGADFSASVGTNARLSDCELRGTSFVEASWCSASWIRCDVREVDLTRARLTQAHWFACDLRESCALNVQAERAALTQCDLSGALWVGAQTARSKWVDTTVASIDLSRADLTRASWHNVSGSLAQLVRANLTNWRVSGASELTRAALDEANLTRASLRGAQFPGASFVRACLDRALVSECDLSGTNGYCAVAKSASFAGSRFDGARWRGANWFGASLRKAHLYDVDLSGANLYGVHTQGVVAAGVALKGAMLVRCRLIEDAGYA